MALSKFLLVLESKISHLWKYSEDSVFSLIRRNVLFHTVICSVIADLHAYTLRASVNYGNNMVESFAIDYLRLRRAVEHKARFARGTDALILLVSLGFGHYPKLQTQPPHRVLWNSLVAIALAFSFFLSLLFLSKVSEDYSRVTLFFQLFGVAAVVMTLRALSRSLIQAAIAEGRVKARRAILLGDPLHYSEVKTLLAMPGVTLSEYCRFPSLSLSTTQVIQTSINRKCDG